MNNNNRPFVPLVPYVLVLPLLSPDQQIMLFGMAQGMIDRARIERAKTAAEATHQSTPTAESPPIGFFFDVDEDTEQPVSMEGIHMEDGKEDDTDDSGITAMAQSKMWNMMRTQLWYL